jgi:SAM-dependent methyltransferase
MKEQSSKSSESKFYKDNIAKEQEKIKEFLNEYLPTGFKPDNIMDFCCGAANEEPVLYELYGENTSITSFDNSEYILQRIKDLGIERKSIVKLDLDDIDNYFQDKKFDLLIGRNIPINPNRRSFGNEKYPDNWPKYLENLRKHMTDNGYLLMTFAREDEFYRAQEILDDLNYNIVSQGANRIIIPSDYIGVAGADIKDNYVILAIKEKQL